MPTTIQVSEELKEELRERGGKGDTYEDVIRGLIDELDVLKYEVGE